MLTPDNQTLTSHFGDCTCAVHCSNTCEPACCGIPAPWCRCRCHADAYRLMREFRLSYFEAQSKRRHAHA